MPNLFIDIETCPDTSRQHLFDLPQPPETIPTATDLLANTLPVIESFLKQYGPCLPGPFLDSLEAAESRAAKPRAGVSGALTAAREAVAKQRTELSVTPEFCRVVALGWAEGDSDPEATVIGPGDDECSILQGFWSLVSYQKPTVIGFNILDFDLRVLMIRSALLGVKPSRLFDLKPWGRDCIDLMKARFPAGKAIGLKRLARLYGLHVPVEDVDGSMVADLIETNPDKVGEYVKSDIDITRQLYYFYQGYFC